MSRTIAFTLSFEVDRLPFSSPLVVSSAARSLWAEVSETSARKLRIGVWPNPPFGPNKRIMMYITEKGKDLPANTTPQGQEFKLLEKQCILSAAF